ncbi:hypothetical protein C2G38_2246129 [Gigaspora rosea]|uniref:Kinase-like domain-containing protein n=1 Tax=Gigaspora rosea TaxID=44941 RepID=A0A397VAA9_9GLOM|nr:hypothetical protein C2G38_2246129 [Gigaspora rosea]
MFNGQRRIIQSQPEYIDKIISSKYLMSAYITDLGLSTSSNMKQKEEISGVMSYVAPEVLMGQAFTQAADIYIFGGKRPEFDKGIHVPDCYVKLAKECIDQDQNKRPTATVIGSIICHWLYEINKDDDNDNEFKKRFLEADKVKLNVESPKHPDHIYTSKFINTKEITNKLDFT